MIWNTKDATATADPESQDDLGYVIDERHIRAILNRPLSDRQLDQLKPAHDAGVTERETEASHP